eukprot:g2421.t1
MIFIWQLPQCKGIRRVNILTAFKREQDRWTSTRFSSIEPVRLTERKLTVNYCASYETNTETLSWEVLSKLPLSEALKEWKVQYRSEHIVEVMEPRYIKETSQTLSEAFGTPSAIPFLDGFFQFLFKADIIGGIQSNIHNRSLDDFVILLVWNKKREQVIGTVQVSRQNEADVLRQLPEDDESYAYISSMAVVNSARRQGIGRSLLSAAEFVAWIWGENEIVLQVYEENEAGCAFYRQQGYEVISRDKKWKAVIRPCTLLMRKQW